MKKMIEKGESHTSCEEKYEKTKSCHDEKDVAKKNLTIIVVSVIVALIVVLLVVIFARGSNSIVEEETVIEDLEELEYHDGIAIRKNSDGSFTLIDSKGNEITPLEDYTNYEGDVEYDVVRYTENGLYGLYSIKNNMPATPCIYEEIGEKRYNNFVVKKNGKYGIMKRSGDKFKDVDCIYDEIKLSADERLHPARLGKKWGYIYDNNDEATQFIFDAASIFCGTAVVKHNGEYKVIDRDGNIRFVASDSGYDYMDVTNSSYYIVRKNGKYGLISEYGYNEELPCIYDEIGKIKHNIPVRVGSYWGFYDYSAENVLYEPQFEDIKEFTSSWQAVKKDGKWGYLDYKGDILFNFQYDDCGLYSVSDELAPVKKGGKWGYIDKTGHVQIPFEYDDAGAFYNKMAMVKKNGKIYYINPSGGRVFPLGSNSIKNIHNFSCGYAVVEYNDGKYGYIDKRGHCVFPKFYKAEDFVNNQAIVHPTDYSMFRIDVNGKQIGDVMYSEEATKLLGSPQNNSDSYDKIMQDIQLYKAMGYKF